MQRRRLLKIMTASAATYGCASTVKPIDEPPPDQPTTLKLCVDYGNRLIVHGDLNGAGPHNFVVDTAASITVIFQNLADRTTAAPSGRPDMSILGLSGVRKTPAFQIGDLRFGDRSLKDHVAPILPDWPNRQRTPQGILGLDFFYDTIAIFDPPNGFLNLWPSDSVTPMKMTAGWSKAPLLQSDFSITEDSLYVLDVALNNRIIPFLLDTGSDVTACNYPAAEHLRVIPPEARRPQTANVADVHGGVVDAFILYVSNITIGSATLVNRSLLISNAPFFEQIGYGAKPFGVLGLDYLRAHRFAVDFRRNNLFLEA